MGDLDRIVRLEFCTITAWSRGITSMTVDHTREEWARRNELGVDQYRQTTSSRPLSLKSAEFHVRWPTLADLFKLYAAIEGGSGRDLSIGRFVRFEDLETEDRFMLRGVRVEGRRFGVIIGSSPLYNEAGPLSDPSGWGFAGGRVLPTPPRTEADDAREQLHRRRRR